MDPKKPWFHRLVDGPATHALVIGVSYYRYFQGSDEVARKTVVPVPPRYDLGQATAPAAGAFAFANWLRSDYCNPDARLANIWLLLSPSPEELQHVKGLKETADSCPSAERENVRDALAEWYDHCRSEDRSNVAIFFAGGHGLQEAGGEVTVLLEDFGKERQVLNHSLDVGLVHRAMTNHAQPRTQFYFIDACRNWPADLALSDNLGKGLALPVEGPFKTDIANPIFFGTTPGSAAYELPYWDSSRAFGHGTLYNHALGLCLHDGCAARKEQAGGHYVVNTWSLSEQLQLEVEQLVSLFKERNYLDEGQKQISVPGGTIRKALFHAFRTPPSSPIRIELDLVDGELDTVRAHASIELHDSVGHVVWPKRPLNPYPLEDKIPAGLYSLNIPIDPGYCRYKGASGILFEAHPRYKQTPGKVSVV